VAEVLIRQVRSANGASPKQRDTLRSLRLGRIGRESRRPDSPGLQGMLRVVAHLVEVAGPETAGSGKRAAEGS
jgi:large subunit ribosomal protein L30